MLKDANGESLTEEEKVKNRKKEYSEMLYSKKDGMPIFTVQEDFTPEHGSLKSEVKKPLGDIANSESAGRDYITWEEGRH